MSETYCDCGLALPHAHFTANHTWDRVCLLCGKDYALHSSRLLCPQSETPICKAHLIEMVLVFYDRPGSPPGNGWACPQCIDERRAASQPSEPHRHTDACYSRVPETEGEGHYLNCGKVAGQPASKPSEPRSDWCDVCNAPQLVAADGEHLCGENQLACYSLGFARGRNFVTASQPSEGLRERCENFRVKLLCEMSMGRHVSELDKDIVAFVQAELSPLHALVEKWRKVVKIAEPAKIWSVKMLAECADELAAALDRMGQ